MRRIALLCATMTITGCEGYNTWWNPPFSPGYSPNTPTIDSENMRRIMGHGAAVAPLTPEGGDIWPGPLPPTPTLQDIEREVDGRGQPPAPVRGSSVPPGQTPSVVSPRILPPVTPPGTPLASPPARDPAGRIIQSPTTPGVTSGGGPGYQTTTTPGGGSAIVVPNGDGTSTIIHSDGRIETVPTPR